MRIRHVQGRLSPFPWQTLGPRLLPRSPGRVRRQIRPLDLRPSVPMPQKLSKEGLPTLWADYTLARIPMATEKPALRRIDPILS